MAAPAIAWRPDLAPDESIGLACIVDTETTGLSSEDEAIELALLLFAYDRSDHSVLGIVDEYAGLREPAVPIGAGAARVHGITVEQVRGRRLDYDRVESILTRASFLIAHNASFDRRFVSPLSETAQEKPWLCSMKGVDWYRKGFGSRGLQQLMAGHEIVTPNAHRAMDDVYGVLHLLAHPPYLAELLEHYRVE